MDYTTALEVKSALGAQTSSDDALLALKITEASRAIDRLCAGTLHGSDNYLLSETRTHELLSGVVALDGRILCYPHKPLVTAVTALSWQIDPRQAWQSVATAALTFDDGRTVEAWIDAALDVSRVRVKVSYTGGLAASVGALPADLVNAATVLAVRFYKEEKTGLTDTIGVAELGTLQYTKAIPARVLEMLKPYTRKLPW